MMLGDLATDVVPVVCAIGGERGDRAVYLVEQGANLRAIVGLVAGQFRRDDPARVGVGAKMQLDTSRNLAFPGAI
jgi:hypothetical protein